MFHAEVNVDDNDDINLSSVVSVVINFNIQGIYMSRKIR